MTTLVSLIAVVALISSIPIFVSLFLSAIVVVLIYHPAPFSIIAQTAFGSLDKFALMAVPFFIFAANVMDRGGLSQRLVDLVLAIFAPVKGALALTTVAACQLFGSISGSSPATVVAIGTLMRPALTQAGYDKRFSLGLVTASGVLGILIPPSITMIIFASITNVSVGALFLAGIGAGIAFGGTIMLYGVYYAWRHNIPTMGALSLSRVWASMRAASWALGAPIIIVGGIYSGIFTATEAAGVVTTYAIIVALFVYREITWKDLMQIAIGSAVLTAQIMIVLSAAGIFAWILTVDQLQSVVTAFVQGSGSSPFVILCLINVVLLIAGMFLDPNSAQVILVPLLFPIAVSIGVDPVHFGMIVTANLAIGMFTPPFGLNLFVAKELFKVSFKECVMSVLPFIFVTLVGLALVVYVPWFSLVVPRLAGY